jgi:hypothetical protein
MKKIFMLFLMLFSILWTDVLEVDEQLNQVKMTEVLVIEDEIWPSKVAAGEDEIWPTKNSYLSVEDEIWPTIRTNNA